MRRRTGAKCAYTHVFEGDSCREPCVSGLLSLCACTCHAVPERDVQKEGEEGEEGKKGQKGRGGGRKKERRIR